MSKVRENGSNESKMKRQVVLLATIVLTALAGFEIAYGQWWEVEKDFKVSVWPVKGNIYLVRGAGGNIAASVGRDGVLLVDSGTEQMADEVLAAIKRLQRQVNSVPPPLGFAAETRSSVTRNTVEPPKPIRYIINTSLDPEHVGGNAKISVVGDTIAGGNVGNYAPTGAAIISHENVLGRLSTQKPPVPDAALPTDVYHLPQYKLSNFRSEEHTSELQSQS